MGRMARLSDGNSGRWGGELFMVTAHAGVRALDGSSHGEQALDVSISAEHARDI